MNVVTAFGVIATAVLAPAALMELQNPQPGQPVEFLAEAPGESCEVLDDPSTVENRLRISESPQGGQFVPDAEATDLAAPPTSGTKLIVSLTLDRVDFVDL
jgi:hypothetical protein